MIEGGLVPFVGLAVAARRRLGGCRTEVPYCRRPPSEYVWEHVAFTTQPLEEPPDDACCGPVIEACEPPDTMCFSSDYPHWDFDDPRQTLRRLPEEWRDAVAYAERRPVFRLSAAGGGMSDAPASAHLAATTCRATGRGSACSTSAATASG